MKVIDENEIQALYQEADALKKLRAGFMAFSAGRVQMPPVQQFLFKQAEGDCCIKSAWVEGSDGFCVKISSGFYRNPAQGLPSNDGLVMLFSATTGQPQVLLNDHGWLTGVRTALAGRIAAELLLPAKVDKIAIFGTGLQAELQLRQLLALTACRQVTVWGRSDAALARFRDALSGLSIELSTTLNAEDAARGASVIVTATPSTTPLIHAEWISPGTHITAVGADSPGKQELDGALVASAHCVLVDSVKQCRAYGELSHHQGDATSQRVIEIGELLASPGAYKRDPEHITIADLTGLGVQDAQIAASILAQL